MHIILHIVRDLFISKAVGYCYLNAAMEQGTQHVDNACIRWYSIDVQYDTQSADKSTQHNTMEVSCAC